MRGAPASGHDEGSSPSRTGSGNHDDFAYIATLETQIEDSQFK